ncbi:MAG: class I SAM-dependent methyltransferase [Firmicutes bacterium]|nr:class I SAM-dependent methyltransferase [Bacillota bacterium]
MTFGVEASRLIVTTTQPREEQIKLAQELAARVGGQYVSRGNRSVKQLKAQGYSIVVVEASQITWYPPGEGRVFFHPSMAKLRIKECRTKGRDQMVEALGLRPGAEVLDCTLGLGADAIVASFVVGHTGRVVGIEASPVLAELVRWGLSCYVEPNPELTAAMRRIEVVTADHLDYLRSLPDQSFDVVYFDPMFRRPILASSALKPVRRWVNSDPLRLEAVQEAQRVSRARVVMKEHRGSSEFTRLGFTEVRGGKYSRVAYGIWEKT